MEQVEETNTEIPRKKTTQPKSKSSLPLDETSEILLRLPTKSIARFHCVSKLWSAITTDPYFISSFNIRSSTRPSILMLFIKEDEWFVFSIPQDGKNPKESSTSSIPIGSYQMKSPYSFSNPTQFVNGLICFQDSGKHIMWNPTLRKFITLPQPEESWTDSVCFTGYDPVKGKYKVLCMLSMQYSDEGRVLTLGSESQQSWRVVKSNHMHHVGNHSMGRRCINGVVYYDAGLPHPSNTEILMSFDVSSEKFRVITLPAKHCGMIMSYEGRLACAVETSFTNGGITFWILEDAEKHKWSCKHCLNASLEHYVPSLECIFVLNSINHAGEFIYVPFESYNTTFYILYFDPKRNSFREIEFADEEFRVRNGIGETLWGTFYSSPDHMESLMFL